MHNSRFHASGPERCDGMPILGAVVALRAIHDRGYGEFYREVARAELDQEISEFQALCLQALLEVAQGDGCEDESLGMAEVVASAAEEHAYLRDCRDICRWLRQHPLSAFDCSQAATAHDEHVELNPASFIKLCIASSRPNPIGDVADTHAA